MLKESLSDPMKPGYNIKRVLWSQAEKYFDRIINFMGEIQSPCADIGERGSKSTYIGKHYNIPIDQIDVPDFNFNSFPKGKKYKTITCFETLEHVQNPMFLVSQIKSILDEDGVIYMSLPGRMRILWADQHFFEIPPKHLQKWILTPLDLRIIRKRKIDAWSHSWWFYISGFRPLLRLFFNYSWIYEIRTGSCL